MIFLGIDSAIYQLCLVSFVIHLWKQYSELRVYLFIWLDSQDDSCLLIAGIAVT